MSFLKEYTLLGELGKGGFAKVYKVRHNELGYIRAIRVLNEPITDERSRTYQKFLHECKVLLRLGNGSHRNIVHIYQPRLLDNHALVEMDYVDGQDITHYLKENGNWLPVEEVLRMVEEMSDALAYCHEDIYQFCMDPDEDDLQNDPMDGSKWLIDDATKKKLVEKYKVIHNDIHSGNIMRRRDGSFVLLDFGLAIEGDEVVKSSSRHENGSPEYMPPEKWDNDTILTEQSDVYSFGVVMYEYLAGRVPFVSEGNSFNARTRLYEQIKNSTSLPSIDDLRKSFFEEKYTGKTYKKDFPDWLETAILRCLEKDPAKRFRNGKELCEFVTKHLKDDVVTKESVQKLSDENVALREEKQQALAQIAILTQRNNDLANLANSAARDLERARKEIEMQQQKHQDEWFVRELKVLQEKIKQKDEAILSLQKDIMKLESQVASTKGNADFQMRIDELQRQCDSLGKDVEQTRQEKRDLEEKMEKLKKSGGKKRPLPIVLCALLSVAVAVLGALYFLNLNKGGDVPSDYDSIKTENAELKKTNNELQSRIADYEKLVADLNAEIAELRKTNNELQNRVDDYEKLVTDLNAEINDLKNGKPTPSAREKELEKQLNQAYTEIVGLNKRIEELQDELKKKPAPSDNEKELKKQLQTAKNTISELKAENLKLTNALNACIEGIINKN